MGDKPLCALYSLLYYLSDMSLHFVAVVMLPSSNYHSISLGLSSLTNRKALEPLELLLLLRDVCLYQGGMIFRVWSHSLLGGFSCHSFVLF